MLGCQKYKLDRPLPKRSQSCPTSGALHFRAPARPSASKKALTPKRGKKHQHTEPAPK